MYIHPSIYMPIYISISRPLSLCLYIRIYLSICIYLYIYTHTYTYLRTHTHIYIYIYVYKHISIVSLTSTARRSPAAEQRAARQHAVPAKYKQPTPAAPGYSSPRPR